MRIAFLASHNGSAANAITLACREGRLVADPLLLITNNADSGALIWAKEFGLETTIVNQGSAEERDDRISNLLRESRIELVVCSGYMRLIGQKTIEAACGRILNIHPALLPKYGGKGMYGSRVHQAVFENKDAETGITIHLVDSEYDRGKILAQKSIPVRTGDTAEIIEANVKAAEPDFYIGTIKRILDGSLSLA